MPDRIRAIQALEEYMVTEGFGNAHVKNRVAEVERFIAWLDLTHSIRDLRDVSRTVVMSYFEMLATAASDNGKPYSGQTRRLKFAAVKLLFRALILGDMILTNPTRGIAFPKRRDPCVRVLFSQEEMRVFLDSITISTPVGLRDRAMFELAYSSGLRRSELIRLDVGDYDAANRLLLIRESKWGKDRVVPVSQVAAAFVEKQIAGRRKEEPMFGSRRFRLSQTRIRKVFKRRLKESGIDKPGATLHSIRHATATHLLLNGAPIRYVQELLGHESIETTVRYTHVLTENLKRIYRQFHPRENALYKEVTKEYVDRLAEFKAELIRVRGENRKEKTVERKRKWEEKRLRKGG